MSSNSKRPELVACSLPSVLSNGSRAPDSYRRRGGEPTAGIRRRRRRTTIMDNANGHDDRSNYRKGQQLVSCCCLCANMQESLGLKWRAPNAHISSALWHCSWPIRSCACSFRWPVGSRQQPTGHGYSRRTEEGDKIACVRAGLRSSSRAQPTSRLARVVASRGEGLSWTIDDSSCVWKHLGQRPRAKGAALMSEQDVERERRRPHLSSLTRCDFGACAH